MIKLTTLLIFTVILAGCQPNLTAEQAIQAEAYCTSLGMNVEYKKDISRFGEVSGVYTAKCVDKNGNKFTVKFNKELQ